MDRSGVVRRGRVAAVKIEVTQEDIDHGWRGSTCLCPISRAAARAFQCSVFVGLDHLSVGHPAERPQDWTKHDLPLAARAFIEDFDNGLPCEPFTFETEPL